MAAASEDFHGVLEACGREHAKPRSSQDGLCIHPDQGTVIHDERSLRFFERNGYMEAARRPMIKDGWQTRGTDWILMRKP